MKTGSNSNSVHKHSFTNRSRTLYTNTASEPFTNTCSRTVHEPFTNTRSRTLFTNRSRTVHEPFTNRSRTRVHEHCSRTVHEHRPQAPQVGGGWWRGWWRLEAGGDWWRLVAVEAGGGEAHSVSLCSDPHLGVHEPFTSTVHEPFTNTVHEHCSRTVHELFTNTCSRTRVHEQLEHVHHGRSRTRCQNAFTNRSRTTVHEHVVHEHPNTVQVSPRYIVMRGGHRAGIRETSLECGRLYEWRKFPHTVL